MIELAAPASRDRRVTQDPASAGKERFHLARHVVASPQQGTSRIRAPRESCHRHHITGRRQGGFRYR
jgi:hypothetical protein